jgi:hypothetical protein
MATSIASHRARSPPREQIRELPVFKTRMSHEEGRQSLPSMDPISRPSSTSTQHSLHYSASLPQLPGLSALANIASSTRSPQLRYVWVHGRMRERGEHSEAISSRGLWKALLHCAGSTWCPSINQACRISAGTESHMSYSIAVPTELWKRVFVLTFCRAFSLSNNSHNSLNFSSLSPSATSGGSHNNPVCTCFLCCIFPGGSKQVARTTNVARGHLPSCLFLL